jgi:proline dehydrogenase
MLRSVFLAAAGSSRLERLVQSAPVARNVVRRFVAGKGVDDALRVSRELADDGLQISLDYLGEDTLTAEQALATRDEYLTLLRRLREAGLTPAAEVSVKLSALGQKVDETVASEYAQEICAAAAEAGTTVTLDAEDHTTTDSTLSIVRDLRTEFDWLGTVLQAYLKRTEADCRDFAASGARIRLCKGAYDEPASVAYRAADDVADSYLRCLQVLMAGSGYPMVASHDPQIIAAVPAMARENGRGVDDFEYQMLYGIRDAEQRRLADAGNHVRVYVPFGTQWYGYFLRRLAERPANLTFFLRALAERRH